MTTPVRTVLPAVALALLAGGAQATTLTFEGVGPLGLGSGTAFGDRVTSAGTGVNLAGGATPNVVLDFVPTNSGSPFTVWSSGYGSLSSALGHGSFNVKGYIELAPDAGWDVVLHNFDIAGWSASSYADSRIQVLDTAGTVYFDSGVFTFPASTTFTAYLSEPIRSSLPLRLFVEDFGDLGIDNLQFSQVATIPEPGTWALWLAGMGVVGTLARRRAAR
jgi:hypothetical protein